MPNLSEWIEGRTVDGVELDAATVAKYRQRANRDIIRSQPPAGSPKKTTLLQSALTLASVVAQTAKRGSLLDEATIAQRLAICQSCEHYTGTSCKLCGCGCGGAKKLTNKLAHHASVCPAGKWGPVE